MRLVYAVVMLASVTSGTVKAQTLFSPDPTVKLFTDCIGDAIKNGTNELVQGKAGQANPHAIVFVCKGTAAQMLFQALVRRGLPQNRRNTPTGPTIFVDTYSKPSDEQMDFCSRTIDQDGRISNNYMCVLHCEAGTLLDS